MILKSRRQRSTLDLWVSATVRSQIVDVKNVGTESLHINGVNVTDRTAFDILPDFAVPITFTPGMERSIRITFNPSEPTRIQRKSRS